MAVTVVRGSSSATSQGVGSNTGAASPQSTSSVSDVASEAVAANFGAAVVVQELASEAAVYFSRSVSGETPEHDIRDYEDADETASVVAEKIRGEEHEGREAHGEIHAGHARGHLTA